MASDGGRIMINTVDDLVIEALFVSILQPSETPSATTVEAAVTRMILEHGSDGCAAVVAAEFGDHPETAVGRMRWVRQTLDAIAERSVAPQLSY
jgi:hypothetical protein